MLVEGRILLILSISPMLSVSSEFTIGSRLLLFFRLAGSGTYTPLLPPFAQNYYEFSMVGSGFPGLLILWFPICEISKLASFVSNTLRGTLERGDPSVLI